MFHPDKLILFDDGLYNSTHSGEEECITSLISIDAIDKGINKKKNAIKIKMNSIKNKSNVTHSEVDALIDEMDELDRERKKLRRVHQKGVNDILTPGQRLKYVNFDGQQFPYFYLSQAHLISENSFVGNANNLVII